MEQWCVWLLGILAVPAQTANAFVSWVLDNVPGLREIWEGLAAIVKMAVLAILTGAIGYGCYRAAPALGCADLPDLFGYLYTLLMAVLGIFIGGKRHEQDKRREAEERMRELEAEAERLRRLLEHKG